MTVGIVGAGITGLALHQHLQSQGVDSVVLEASAEPGGVMQTIERDGHVLDLGPQRTRRTPGIDELIRSAGLGDEVVEANDVPLYVYHDGSLGEVPLSTRAALRTDLLSWRGKFRALAEPLHGPPRTGETVHGYLTRAFGSEVAERVGGPLYAGLYASDPAEMPVEHSLARALDHLGVERSVLLAAMRSRLQGRDPPPAISFERGIGSLPKALASQYAETVDLERPVETIEPSQETRYRLVTPSGDSNVDRVVLTVPANEASRLLQGLDPTSAAALHELAYNPLVVVHLHARLQRSGAGHQVALGEDFLTRGVTWNDSLLDRDGVYTAYLGGAGHETILAWEDDRLGQTAAREFEHVTGAAASVLSVRRIDPGMPAYDHTWPSLDAVDLPNGIHLCANYESRAGIPGRVRQAKSLAEELAATRTGHESRPDTTSPPADPGVSS